MEVNSEEHRGRPATGRSQESLELEKLSWSIWYGSRSSVWLMKRIHDTWKVVKGMSSFNFDLISDSDLLLYRNRPRDLHQCVYIRVIHFFWKLKNEKWKMKICVQFSFFLIKKWKITIENWFSIFIFL